MNKLNEKGLSIIELIVTFALIMIIVSGLLTIIMNYRGRMQTELKRLDLVSYKNNLTKDIQQDIMDKGLQEINGGGECESWDGQCINIVFKDGVQKILATSKTIPKEEDYVGLSKDELKDFLEDYRELLENKFIKYGDIKYKITDKLPSKFPNLVDSSNRDWVEMYYNSQAISVMYDDKFYDYEEFQLKDGSSVRIYSIDINISHIDYSDEFGIHIVATNNDVLNANSTSQDFVYTGLEQVYNVKASGTYKIEAWGASGGDFCINSDDESDCIYSGGLGSYASGYVYLTKDTNLYIHVGGKGKNNNTTGGVLEGGYNGGGSASDGLYASSGGGASDVRLVSGDANSFTSLKSRILVAAGGGGANNRNLNVDVGGTLFGAGNGGAGGGLIGSNGTISNYKASGSYTSFEYYGLGFGASQNNGGFTKSFVSANDELLDDSNSIVSGNFGFTKPVTTTSISSIDFSSSAISGAGGGWFAGGAGFDTGAGGGSSYISGHNGCLAIDQASTESNIIILDNSDYPNYHFDNTVMIDGEGYLWTTEKQEQKDMPLYSGKNGDVGNKGDGYVRITYLGA